MIFTEMKDEEVISLVDPMMEACLAGSNEDNHEKHTKHFTDRMKNIVTPENLKTQLCYEPRAYFTKRVFLHLFRREKSIGVVWKQYISISNDELTNQAIFIQNKDNILFDNCMIC